MFQVTARYETVKVTATKAEWKAVDLDPMFVHYATTISANLGMLPRDAPDDRPVAIQFADRASSTGVLRPSIARLLIALGVKS
jgi:hypothetical protein